MMACRTPLSGAQALRGAWHASALGSPTRREFPDQLTTDIKIVVRTLLCRYLKTIDLRALIGTPSDIRHAMTGGGRLATGVGCQIGAPISADRLTISPRVRG